MKKSINILFLFLLLPALLLGQTRKELEKKRKGLIQGIKKTNQLLKETSKNKNLVYEKYITLKEQIEQRKELIDVIHHEIEFYDHSFARTSDVIESLTNDIEHLKKDYNKLLRLAYKRKIMKSDLLFIFSAQSFNEGILRWQYIKQYDKYRKKQAQRILATQESLSQKIELQKKRKKEKERLLESEKNHLISLEHELETKNELLKELKKNEQKLRTTISNNKSKHETLNVAIENIIDGDFVGNRKNNRIPKAPQLSTLPHQKDANKKSKTEQTQLFLKQKGRLPWPVYHGVISSKFGKQSHPTLNDIIINNSGIDILTRKGAKVNPIMSGTVVAVRYVVGNDYLVIVQHGNYFTLYSQLEEHFIQKGDKVTPQDNIGTVRTDSQTGKTELHFEVWHSQTRLNPENWIIKK